MNKKLFTACVLSGVLLSVGTANADEEEQSYLAGFGSRVSQGFANTTTGFIELPKNVINISNESNIFVGATWGVLRGVFESVGRTTVGVAELITAPIPTDPYVTPPYVWNRFSEDSRYFGQHLPGYWTTYGPADDGE